MCHMTRWSEPIYHDQNGSDRIDRFLESCWQNLDRIGTQGGTTLQL